MLIKRAFLGYPLAILVLLLSELVERHRDELEGEAGAV